MLFKTYEPFFVGVADDDVVQDVYAEKIAGLNEVGGDGGVLGAGGWVTGRMVVYDDDGGGVGFYGSPEDFGGPDLGGIYVTYVDFLDFHNPVLGVKEDYLQMLLSKETHLVPKKFEYVLRLADRRPILSGIIAKALAQFEARLNLGGLGIAHSVYLDKLIECGTSQSAQGAITGYYSLSHIQGALSIVAHSQQDCDKLSVAKALSAVMLEPFPRPFV